MTRLLPVLMAGLLVSTACASNQPDYEEMANTALRGSSMADVTADYNADEGVVHVTGTVPTENDRKRAGEVVEQAVGAGARVANEVTVEGGHTEAADDLDAGIETRLQNLVEADPQFREGDVEFDANNGVVTVTGRVPSDAVKSRLDELVRNVPGVRDVVNTVEVRAAS